MALCCGTTIARLLLSGREIIYLTAGVFLLIRSLPLFLPRSVRLIPSSRLRARQRGSQIMAESTSLKAPAPPINRRRSSSVTSALK